MDKKENGFSLIIVVIFMSIAAVFVGYLMGSWLIGFMMEEPAQQSAQNNVEEVEEVVPDKNSAPLQNSPAEDEDTAESIEQGEISVEEENTEQTAVQEGSSVNQENDSEEQSSQTAQTEEKDQTQPESSDSTEGIQGSYGVQVGAFNNYDSALSIKNEIEELGFKVYITDSKPHKIQVGAFQNREEAEKVEAELEEQDYNGFIVLRE